MPNLTFLSFQPVISRPTATINLTGLSSPDFRFINWGREDRFHPEQILKETESIPKWKKLWYPCPNLANLYRLIDFIAWSYCCDHVDWLSARGTQNYSPLFLPSGHATSRIL